ncbi:MAG: hypothetical protein VW102_03900 [Poseidonia sp.]
MKQAISLFLGRFMTSDDDHHLRRGAPLLAHAHPEMYKKAMQVGPKAQVATLGL